MLQHIYDPGRFTWANAERAATVRLPETAPESGAGWVSQLPPKVGPIHNEAIWNSTTQRWQGSQQRRTLQRDVHHHRQYLLHGHSLQHAGCVPKPLLRLARGHICMCILRYIKALGRWVVPFLEALRSDLNKVLVSMPSWTGHAPGFFWAPLPRRMGRRCTACSSGGSRYKMGCA